MASRQRGLPVKQRLRPSHVENQILAALAEAGAAGLSIDEIMDIVDTGVEAEWGVIASRDAVHAHIWNIRNELGRSISTTRRYYLSRFTQPHSMVAKAREKREVKYGQRQQRQERRLG